MSKDIPDDLTREQYRETYLEGLEPEAPETAPVPAWRRFLTPTFRRWAYGVAVAAVIAYAAVTKQPEVATIAAPLIMALFYVDSNGDPR